MSLQHAPPHTNLCFCWHFLSEIGLSCAGLAQPHSPHMCTFLCEVHPTAIAHRPSMSLRPHLYGVASVFGVLRQRRVWVKMNPSEYEGLAQTVAATKKGKGSLYDIFARINSSLISQ